MDPTEEHDAEAIFTNADAPRALQPGVDPFDLPSMSSSAELTTVLRRGFHAFPTVRVDEVDASGREAFTPGIAIRGAVVEQSRLLRQLHDRGIRQSFDMVYLTLVGRRP